MSPTIFVAKLVKTHWKRSSNATNLVSHSLCYLILRLLLLNLSRLDSYWTSLGWIPLNLSSLDPIEPVQVEFSLNQSRLDSHWTSLDWIPIEPVQVGFPLNQGRLDSLWTSLSWMNHERFHWPDDVTLYSHQYKNAITSFRMPSYILESSPFQMTIRSTCPIVLPV